MIKGHILQKFDDVLINLTGLRVDLSVLPSVEIAKILARAINELVVVARENDRNVPEDFRNPALVGIKRL